ncbi:unnamed protein product [Rhizophagus irregularis]|nr:unnamed protein product [Rhizophagus irregularis]
MTKSFSKDANILSLEEEEIIKGLDYPVSLFMDTSNEVMKQKYTNSLSKSFMTHESILISGRETLLSQKYDKESTHNKWIEILYKRSKWCLLDSQISLILLLVIFKSRKTREKTQRTLWGGVWVSGNQISNLVDDLDDNILGELSRFEDY